MKPAALGNILYPMEMSPSDHVSTKALAVAIVAISKSVAALSPDFGRNLAQSLASAEEAGIPPDELALLRLLVTSASSTKANPKNPLF